MSAVVHEKILWKNVTSRLWRRRGERWSCRDLPTRQTNHTSLAVDRQLPPINCSSTARKCGPLNLHWEMYQGAHTISAASLQETQPFISAGVVVNFKVMTLLGNKDKVIIHFKLMLSHVIGAVICAVLKYMYVVRRYVVRTFS